MTVRLDWYGAAILRTIEDAGTSALRDASEFVLEESNRTVPIEEGTLERSGSTDVDGHEASIFYDTPYAVRLHENPQYHFQHGRRGKWLSLTLGEQRDRLQRFFGERMKAAFK